MLIFEDETLKLEANLAGGLYMYKAMESKAPKFFETQEDSNLKEDLEIKEGEEKVIHGSLLAIQIDSRRAEVENDKDKLLCIKRGTHTRQALREATYLKTELQGWKATKASLDGRISTHSTALVLVISMLYTGAFSPPGGFVTTTVVAPDKHESTSVSHLPQVPPSILFFYCSGIGFAFSVVGMFIVVVYTLFPTMQGEVTKVIDAFVAYVTDIGDCMLGDADDDPVSITYQDAIMDNIQKALTNYPMKYFVKPSDPTYVKGSPVNHKLLFDEVLQFFERCLPGEIEICSYLQKSVSCFLIVALLCTIAAYASAILYSSVSNMYAGPTYLMLGLVILGTTIPLVVLVNMLDFDTIASRFKDGPTGPLRLVHNKVL